MKQFRAIPRLPPLAFRLPIDRSRPEGSPIGVLQRPVRMGGWRQLVPRWQRRIIALAILVPRLAAAQSITFPAPQVEPLVEVPSAIGIGDLNDDGRPDIVVANFLAATVTIYLTGDDPVLTFVGDFPSGGPGHRVLVQEVTGDFVADVLVSEQESDNVWLLRGAGDGTVGEPELINPGHDPVGLAVRDLDGDGIVDLVVALSPEEGGRLAIMLGRGDGAFELIQTVVVPEGSEEVAIADFDDDKILDAAVTSAVDSSVSILRGTGGGMFADPVKIPVSGGASPLALGDVDEDGFADLVVGLTNNDTVALLRGQDGGTFADPEVTATAGQAMKAMVVADVNGDTHLDVVTANLRSQTLSVLIGRGDGSFAPARGFVTQPNPIGLAAFDVDGDSVVDLLNASEGPGSAQPGLVLLKGLGDGDFDAVDQLPAPAAGSGVAIADFDEDAFADAVGAFMDDKIVRLFPGGAARASVPGRSFSVDASPAAVLAADVDLDGHADVVTLDATAEISLLRGSGTGDFGAVEHQPLPARGRAFAAMDVDHDRDPDLFVVDVNGDLEVLLNDGSGTFQPLEPIPLPVQASDIAVGDFNDDDHLDVAMNQVSEQQILVFLGKEEGGFEEPMPVSTRAIVFSLVPADLDGNGTLDLFISSPGAHGATPLVNDGTGMFTLGIRRFAGTFPTNVAVRDLNNDGFPEAIVNDQLGDQITVLVNDGVGSFSSDPSVLASIAPAAVGTGDFDGNGSYDVLVVGRTVCRLRNTTATTAPPVLRGDGNGDQRLSAADFIALALELHDGDGSRADDTSRGGFAGNPGADADGDGLVTVADARALLVRFWRAVQGS